MSTIIRSLNVNDVSTIIDLEMKYLGETIGSDMLISESTNPSIKFLVLEKNHVVIGYIGCYYFENSNGFELYAYKDGVVKVIDLYNDGILSDSDIEQIEEYYYYAYDHNII